MKKESKHTKGEWKLESKPYFRNKTEWIDLWVERYNIYEDNSVKVNRVYSPEYMNEGNNYIDVLFKSNGTIINFPIGGYITYEQALANAQRIVSAVNMHDDLVGTLNSLKSIVETMRLNDEFKKSVSNENKNMLSAYLLQANKLLQQSI